MSAVDHPPWCARTETTADGWHTSAPIDCNPGNELVGIAVRLRQPWPPYERIPPAVALEVTHEAVTERWLLPRGQAVALRDGIGSLLRLARDGAP